MLPQRRTALRTKQIYLRCCPVCFPTGLEYECTYLALVGVDVHDGIVRIAAVGAVVYPSAGVENGRSRIPNTAVDDEMDVAAVREIRDKLLLVVSNMHFRLAGVTNRGE